MSGRVPLGALAMCLHLFDPAEAEIRRALEPPWPRSIRHLYELASLGDEEVAPATGEVPVSAAIGAVDTELHHRLTLLSWVTGKLESLGWRLYLRGSDAVAVRVTTPEAALLELEDAGVLGPLLKVCATDDAGRPLFLSRADLRRRGAA